MITRLEIDGFKSFYNFGVDLRPFQVLVGPNGSGKSNLFDAITLLGRLAHMPIVEALLGGRGDVDDQFSKFGTQQSRHITFGVEILLPRHIIDETGQTIELKATRLRYDLRIERSNDNTRPFRIRYERLRSLAAESDTWATTVIPTNRHTEWLVYPPEPVLFLETREVAATEDDRNGSAANGDDEIQMGFVYDLYGHGADPTVSLQRSPRTLLGFMTSTAFPTLLAIREEMQGWQTMHLNPALMRLPVSRYAPTRLLSDGSNLAAVVNAIQERDPAMRDQLSVHTIPLLPGVRGLTAASISDDRQLELRFQLVDGQTLPAGVMSDGELRVAALLAVRFDTAHHGVLCLEEPENGINPLMLQKWCDAVLRRLATDFETDESDGALRQILISTHAPSMTNFVPAENMLMMLTPAYKRNTRAAAVAEDDPLNTNVPPLTVVSKHYIRQMLASVASPEAWEQSE